MNKLDQGLTLAQDSDLDSLRRESEVLPLSDCVLLSTLSDKKDHVYNINLYIYVCKFIL